MISVLMCGNHSTNKGGMTSVINQILEKDWKAEGVELNFIPTYLPGSKIQTITYFIMAYLKILLFFLLHKPDVFYTHMSVRGSFSRTISLHNICKIFKVKDVIHLHGSEFEQWYRSETLEKKKKISNLFETCGTVIVLGQKWEHFVHEISPGANIKQIHNCIDIPESTVSWNDASIRFLFLGVLIPRKGVHVLLQAVKQLAERNLIENYEFAIGGTGPEENNLKKYVRENNIDNNVKFLGWLEGSKKTEEIMKSNVFILPSYNEGLPVAILECMSFGLPVISTNVGDIADAVKEGVNGYLVTPGDTEAIISSIQKVSDKENWYKLSENSRKFAEQQFNINLFYAEILSVWKSCIE